MPDNKKKLEREKLLKPSYAHLGGGDNKQKWTNPLKGNYKELASAGVSVKGLGLFVGVKLKF